MDVSDFQVAVTLVWGFSDLSGGLAFRAGRALVPETDFRVVSGEGEAGNQKQAAQGESTHGTHYATEGRFWLNKKIAPAGRQGRGPIWFAEFFYLDKRKTRGKRAKKLQEIPYWNPYYR